MEITRSGRMRRGVKSGRFDRFHGFHMTTLFPASCTHATAWQTVRTVRDALGRHSHACSQAETTPKSRCLDGVAGRGRDLEEGYYIAIRVRETFVASEHTGGQGSTSKSAF
ncbi:hypothetical protein BD310DRAFT_942139 [Dichomitus squalens]|uniref:Uncharacterized protein n=1 Tax=Dichomitus squalens TaxID=114155 RepID=A0A4Q9PEH2_9APHY|nr:hypothetical protein BD310DRAFT_942139 [Dichomitus squalens]